MNQLTNQPDLNLFEKYFKEWELRNFHLLAEFQRILIILLMSLILKVIFIICYNSINKLTNFYNIAFFVLDFCVLVAILVILLISNFNQGLQRAIIEKFFFILFPNLNLRNYIKNKLKENKFQSPDQLERFLEQWDFNVKKEIQIGTIFLIGLLILDYFQYLLLIQVFFF